MSAEITAAYDIVVVGAGLAGLVAASELLRKAPALACCIIEAQPRWGGQIQSAGEPLMGEVGARWISNGQPHIARLCRELGVELVPLQSGGEEGAAADCAGRDWDIDGGPWSEWCRYELDRFMRYVDDLCGDYFPCQRTLSNAGGGTMEAFIRKHLLFEASRDLVRLVVRFVSGCQADGITFGEYMMLCHGTSGITNQLNW